MEKESANEIVMFCPITKNTVACDRCIMYADHHCLVREGLRSLPRIAEELKQLGWIQRLSETLEDFADPCRLDIEPLEDAEDEDEET